MKFTFPISLIFDVFVLFLMKKISLVRKLDELPEDWHLHLLRLQQLHADACHCARVRNSDGRFYSTALRSHGSHTALEVESRESALVKTCEAVV